MLNTTLQTSAAQVMAKTTPAQFFITALFTSSATGSKYSWYPMFIDGLQIHKDHLTNYYDQIDLMMTVSGKDYALMQDQGQNLLCLLTLTYVDKTATIVTTPAPVQKQYQVILNDARDVRKAIPDIQNYTEASHQVSVRLIEPDLYTMRHTKVNAVFQNATMTQVIHAVTAQLGISKLHLVPPENTHQYDHVPIPSHQGIESVFGYLQSAHGLYTKGSTHYYTNGVLYVYPPHETAPVYDKTVNFYQAPTGDYTGSSSYHSVSGNQTNVVINEQPESYDISIAGSENVGTGFLFTRASRLTDGFTTVDPNQGAQFTDNPSLSVTMPGARTMAQGANNQFHVRSTDNPFTHMSKIAAHQASMMKVPWIHADPFLLDPGHAVNYYYDQNQAMVAKTGIVEQATYRITKMHKVHGLDLFGCVGDLILRLSVNTTQTL